MDPDLRAAIEAQVRLAQRILDDLASLLGYERALEGLADLGKLSVRTMARASAEDPYRPGLLGPMERFARACTTLDAAVELHLRTQRRDDYVRVLEAREALSTQTAELQVLAQSPIRIEPDRATAATARGPLAAAGR